MGEGGRYCKPQTGLGPRPGLLIGVHGWHVPSHRAPAADHLTKEKTPWPDGKHDADDEGENVGGHGWQAHGTRQPVT